MNGHAITTQIIDTKLVRELQAKLQLSLQQCANDLNVTLPAYLSVVSRWALPSLVTACVPDAIIQTMSQAAEKMIGEPVTLSKMNIICKNAHCTGSVPLHQDISYSPDTPYQFSSWLALNDVDEKNGCLEIVPNSHLGPIQPAVDSWSPRFRPPPLPGPSSKVPLQAGDALFFDSRLWHGSGANLACSARYALVMRWTGKSWKLNSPIPPRKPQFFGMWSCGEETKRRLAAIIEEKMGKKETNFTRLLDLGMELFADDIAAYRALMDVKILHLASEKQSGGDATGSVYQRLWNQLLSHYDKPVGV